MLVSVEFDELNVFRSFELFTFFLVACNGLLTGIQISVPWLHAGQPGSLAVECGIPVTCPLKVKGTESCGLSCVILQLFLVSSLLLL